MANRLKVYCRRTILDSAKEGAWPAKRRTAASTRTAFMDAMRGTDTGWWTDLIYTADMLEMAHRYRHDIAAALAEYHDATGEQMQPRAEEFNQADIYAALLRKYSFADYKGDNGDAKARLAEARRGETLGAALRCRMVRRRARPRLLPGPLTLSYFRQPLAPLRGGKERP